LSPAYPHIREGNMKVVRDQPAIDPTESAFGASATTLVTRVPPQPVMSQPPAETTTQTLRPTAAPGEPPRIVVPSQAPPTNVTFRRDEQGKVYYVLTDAESGKEIREVPSVEVRKVGQGIADYLKQEAAQGTSRVKIKG
jgi:hypothetical protein